MHLEGLEGIGRARGIVAAVGTEHWTDAVPVKSDQPVGQVREGAHEVGRAAVQRRVASAIRRSRLRTISGSDASRAPGRLVTT